ncbi:PLP-dependent cysteine synthase family protein [Aestuariispira insulae]|uniref:Cysteine synthase B n=1 Tax=Aestuariispira insulae TaxID=1461337 RepID=A0A3D9H5S3_9PROT|nr:cysteine synthase family protein [Aestuariispira insulae]RED44848.1 cystathionine beta-synthase [Aestuariispira insulae]
MEHQTLPNRPAIVYHYTHTVGYTPLMQLPTNGYDASLFLKLEPFNPMGNMKFRMALSMVDAAERDGLLKPGGRIIESTSGNTGLGLATIAAERGYRFTAIVDSHAAKDKLRAMKALGAELIFVDEGCDGEELSTAAREELAETLAKEDPEAFWTEQHNNPANNDGYTALAEELIAALGPNISSLVAAVGTGGSSCGTARILKRRIPELKMIGVEPVGSIAFGGPGGAYYQSGTGTPEGAEIGECVDFSLIDKGVKVGDVEAFATARYLARRFGVLIGGSAGGAVYAAIDAIRKEELTGCITVIIPDGGEKYLDTIFDDDWMAARGLTNDSLFDELDRFFPPR